MSWSLDLTRRRREPELMDDPGLAAGRHHAALRGLERINRWSGSVRIVWSAIRGLPPPAAGGALRILDVATGAGDVPIGLWRRAQRSNLRVQIEACDASPRAVEFAQQRAARAGAEVRFFPLDVLRDELPDGYDAVVSSLFLHHLADEQAVMLLKKMAAASRRLVVVNDLLRDRPGWLLAYLGSRILSTSTVVHVDAVLSVRAAFAWHEIRAMAAKAGLHKVSLSHRFPRRFLLTHWR